jgi:hypothetical protein
VALQTNTLTCPATDHARPLPELVRMTERNEMLRRVCDYVQIGHSLPDVLDELHHHVAAPMDEAALRVALETLVDACVCAAAMAKELNYMDLGHLAAERAEEAARMLGDPVVKGKADFMWLLTLPHVGSWDRNLIAGERAASELEPHARDPLGMSVLGMLTLTTSLAAASVQRGNTAAHWLSQAASIAARVPDEPTRNWQCFSATNVNIWRVTVGVERGEAGGAVLELADGVALDRLEAESVRSRKAGFMADVGRGLAREPKTRADAVRWLRGAEELAPQRVRNSAPIRETVAYLLGRATATAGGRELRGMAARMGVPH